ncbi:hypothetical protein [Kribbella sp. NPDC006257]|uniref:hypothetical protein n=1 Tax=Kribbella sp. NPDC006257 TaxID=3156738 RepID=UPI0033A38431
MGRRSGSVRRRERHQAESDGFWAWAVAETLRHTGVRIEEMLELTQLSLRRYTSETTGTLVPLLHIVPSKADAERLLPMSPELVMVQLAVQRRAKAGGTYVPLSMRPTRTSGFTAYRSHICSPAGSESARRSSPAPSCGGS